MIQIDTLIDSYKMGDEDMRQVFSNSDSFEITNENLDIDVIG